MRDRVTDQHNCSKQVRQVVHGQRLTRVVDQSSHPRSSRCRWPPKGKERWSVWVRRSRATQGGGTDGSIRTRAPQACPRPGARAGPGVAHGAAGGVTDRTSGCATATARLSRAGTGEQSHRVVLVVEGVVAGEAQPIGVSLGTTPRCSQSPARTQHPRCVGRGHVMKSFHARPRHLPQVEPSAVQVPLLERLLVEPHAVHACHRCHSLVGLDAEHVAPRQASSRLALPVPRPTFRTRHGRTGTRSWARPFG